MKNETKTKPSFAETVWNTLRNVDTSEMINKKQNFDYLPWSAAWTILMEYYPDSDYQFKLEQPIEDGGYEVWCTIIIRDGGNTLIRKMWLPIMDYKNLAVTNPDSRQLSDTRMRCMVKCLAICGLAINIYSGEELGDKPKTKVRINKKAMQASVSALIQAIEDDDEMAIRETMGELTHDEQAFIWPIFDTRQKSAIKSLMMRKEDE